MRAANLIPPPLENLAGNIDALIDEFASKKVVYLDSMGTWKDNPTNLLQRTGNELLFQIWKNKAEGRTALVNAIGKKLSDEKAWLDVKRIKCAHSMKSHGQPYNLKEPELDKTITGFYTACGRPPR
ncbi:MAG: hypothetical protein JXB23_07460, partial [Candidatus Aminicenantes bacterium]|nr:hypothetical protein [Candidatus Aminicenantes bacterium]